MSTNPPDMEKYLSQLSSLATLDTIRIRKRVNEIVFQCSRELGCHSNTAAEKLMLAFRDHWRDIQYNTVFDALAEYVITGQPLAA